MKIPSEGHGQVRGKNAGHRNQVLFLCSMACQGRAAAPCSQPLAALLVIWKNGLEPGEMSAGHHQSRHNRAWRAPEQ